MVPPAREAPNYPQLRSVWVSCLTYCTGVSTGLDTTLLWTTACLPVLLLEKQDC